MPDLKVARDTARSVLQQVRQWAKLTHGMRDPYADAFVDASLPERPSLSDLHKLRDACDAAARAIPNSLVLELAGLTTPSGVEAGASYFASAHELAVSIANAMRDHLSVILQEGEDRPTAASPTDMQSQPEPGDGDATAVPEHRRVIHQLWSSDPIYFRQLVWDVASMAKTVAVPRMLMLLDVEVAQARRNRVLAALVPRGKEQQPPVEEEQPAPNMNPFSPSSRASVMRLLRARATYPPSHDGAVKKTLLYAKADLRGETAQRALKAVLDNVWMTADLELTPAGSDMLNGGKP